MFSFYFDQSRWNEISIHVRTTRYLLTNIDMKLFCFQFYLERMIDWTKNHFELVHSNEISFKM